MFISIHGLLGHLQRADPFRCSKRSKTVRLGRAADRKSRADSAGATHILARVRTEASFSFILLIV
jgi:hypothetical protein